MTTELDTPGAQPQLTTTRAFVDFFINNRFRSALDQFTDAIETYRAVVGRAGFELDTVSMFRCFTLYYLGELGVLSRVVPAMAEAAKRSGNRYTAVTLQCAFAAAWLAHSEPDDIEADLDEALASWSSVDGGYQLQHMLALTSHIDLALYRGEPDRVTKRIADDWKPIRRSLVDRPPMQGILLRFGIIRQAVARAYHAAPGSPARKDALAFARSHMRGLKGNVPLVRHASNMCEAMIVEATGDQERALKLYRAALAGVERADTHLLAHAARYRIGKLVGGDEGKALCNGVYAWLKGEGVRDAGRMLQMMLPAPRKE